MFEEAAFYVQEGPLVLLQETVEIGAQEAPWDRLVTQPKPPGAHSLADPLPPSHLHKTPVR